MKQRSSSTNHQLGLGPLSIPNQERRSGVFSNQEQAQSAVAKPEQISEDAADELSAALLNEALELARLSNDEAGFVLGVSADMVRKMRSTETRARMSMAQFIRLSFFRPSFYLAYQKAIEARTGWLSRHAMEAQREATAFFAAVSR